MIRYGAGGGQNNQLTIVDNFFPELQSKTAP
jgi:hypothetical protein